ncbi:hypothetical protein AO067_00860 [Pseudomonas viridiflava ICMP 13104]|uniref:Uncharacterized protein n=1 Tax=Pseudomonas viridiflava ICMP 13104 TaxID=1198305 RepID=A0A0W0HA98_PSEVI|nr:hypothetical protein AO067_00860 [Pseudomonas viridiflava ICMP 13104]
MTLLVLLRDRHMSACRDSKGRKCREGSCKLQAASGKLQMGEQLQAASGKLQTEKQLQAASGKLQVEAVRL